MMFHVNKSTSVDAQQLKDRIKQAKSLCVQSKEETLRMRLQHVGPSVTLFFQSNPMKIVRGCGQYLYDELGNEFLDCINNVSHVGHGNKHVADAVQVQMHLLNTNSRFLHENLSIYAKRLTALFPEHLEVCYLVNSGSEANDLAIRLARAHTANKDIVSLDGAYHGNLTSTMAISPYKTHKLYEHKQSKWAHVAPLPCAYRGQFQRDQFGGDEATVGRLYASATEQVIESARARGRGIAALFAESMVSCGGQTPLPSGYLRQLQQYLHSIGALLVCDEVQTGFGRSGKRMWAFQLDGDDIRPDIVTLGKPMGNGFPIAAVVTTRQVAESFSRIGTEYFNTFGGNPASCAAALAVLDELERGQLQRQAHELGQFMLVKLRELQARSSIIGDVRGLGFFIGIDLVKNLKTKQAAPNYAQFIVEKFRDERILMSTEGKLGNVLKFKPPMVFNKDDAERFLAVLVKAHDELELQIAQRETTATSGECADRPRMGHTIGQQSAGPSVSSASSASSSSWLESSIESADC